jgi:hypothetical protein
MSQSLSGRLKLEGVMQYPGETRLCVHMMAAVLLTSPLTVPRNRELGY